jgi:hypothetical protein
MYISQIKFQHESINTFDFAHSTPSNAEGVSKLLAGNGDG